MFVGFYSCQADVRVRLQARCRRACYGGPLERESSASWMEKVTPNTKAAVACMHAHRPSCEILNEHCAHMLSQRPDSGLSTA